ncbi:MAG: hypothetical protein HN683_04705 [Gammaproteobacteria bacterium]|nr:hypothetical protein [Gammaproteobacteria bacterium]
MTDTTQLPALSIESLPEEFFIDLAVGVNSYVDICDNYDIDEATAQALETDPLFTRRMRIAQQVVDDDGTAFRSRCRSAVTNSVHNVVHMMADADVPASTQLDAFKTLVKYGGLEPPKTDETGAAGPQLVLNIVAPDGAVHNFGVATPPVTTVDVQDAEFEEVEPLSILPPAASNLFEAS